MWTEMELELLAPAGSPEALDAAIGEGADAVYLGLKDFNARMRSANFTYSQFESALNSLRRMDRKVYVTVNTVFEQREADRVYQLLKYLAGLAPDGILVQDLGIITMVRDNFPSLKLHASTQMNVASARGVNLLSRYGFSRAVLARELSLDEIRDIRANTNMELEVFVHGALCVSVSGLCLFSSYLGGKSANRGMCTQACRRLYTAYKGKSLEVPEEDDGGYYFSTADLELIEQLPSLAKAGINSFKIEGRMKSAEYVGTVVSAYRLVIDNLNASEGNLRKAIVDARSILKNDFARSKTVYLINGSEGEKRNEIHWLNPNQNGGTGIPLGKLLRVRGRDEKRQGLIEAGSIAPSQGDSIRLHRADDSERLSHKISAVEVSPNGDRWISIPEGFGPDDAVYLIQTKAMTKRYAPVIRGEPSARGPGREKASPPKAEWLLKKKRADTQASEKSRGKKDNTNRTDLPAGIYAMVSRIEDLYILQSSRPVKVILPYSRKLAKQLLGDGQKLPFPANDIIISLDPFFPQGKDGELDEAIPALMEKNYTRFIINNLGQFSFFRQRQDAALIAGPWLYTFNAWAWDYISGCGADYCITPFENNRQNLEKTFSRQEQEQSRRSRVFVTVFARPSLFRMRRDLGAFYNFENFTGSRDEAFRLVSAPEGSLVFPWDAFCIVDKIPFLQEAAFSRFILDFSSGPLKKAEYRTVTEALNRVRPLSGTKRFNWKNGFYSAQTTAPPKKD
jgi:putative protease